mmetsp:Transcript_4796/g.8522  ORF Transcript_4796/g.8522 Transcript_4796/m.8522 type:complete len:233 (+) Transcript_4796:59-757(+)
MMDFSKPLHLNIPNVRLHKLTSRVICLSSCSAILVIIGAVLSFLDRDETLEQYHTSEADNASSVHKFTDTPSGKVLSAVVLLLIALAVPCCGYMGARNSNKMCLCCFSCCNCIGGCLNIILICLTAVSMAGLASVQESCRPTADSSSAEEQCKEILKACKNFKSDSYKLDTYEGCYDFMLSSFPYLYGMSAIVIAFMCCSVSMECASAYWGKELYDELAENGESLHESDYEA